uniref:CSON013658 protein n=1 Tax=Culicoides sonorensis TaxID=179676 RepID=A0A336LI10_CULSO
MFRREIILVSIFCFIISSQSKVKSENIREDELSDDQAPLAIDSIDEVQNEMDREKRGDFKLVKIELEKKKNEFREPDCDCKKHPQFNVEYKKALDLTKLSSAKSTDLVRQFQNLLDQLTKAKHEDENRHFEYHDNEKPGYLPNSNYYIDQYHPFEYSKPYEQRNEAVPHFELSPKYDVSEKFNDQQRYETIPRYVEPPKYDSNFNNKADHKYSTSQYEATPIKYELLPQYESSPKYSFATENYENLPSKYETKYEPRVKHDEYNVPTKQPYQDDEVRTYGIVKHEEESTPGEFKSYSYVKSGYNDHQSYHYETSSTKPYLKYNKYSQNNQQNKNYYEEPKSEYKTLDERPQNPLKDDKKPCEKTKEHDQGYKRLYENQQQGYPETDKSKLNYKEYRNPYEEPKENHQTYQGDIKPSYQENKNSYNLPNSNTKHCEKSNLAHQINKSSYDEQKEGYKKFDEQKSYQEHKINTDNQEEGYIKYEEPKSSFQEHKNDFDEQKPVNKNPYQKLQVNFFENFDNHPLSQYPHHLYSQVKGGSYSNDHEIPTHYNEYDQTNQKAYPYKQQQIYQPVLTKTYPCNYQSSLHAYSPYNFPRLYNPNRYKSLERENSPIHNPVELLKHFEKKDFEPLNHQAFINRYLNYNGKSDDLNNKEPITKYDPHHYDSSYGFTKRNNDQNKNIKNIKKSKEPDWEEIKAIAGNAELQSYLPTEYDNTNDKKDNSDNDEVNDEHVVKLILNELAHIREELNKRETYQTSEDKNDAIKVDKDQEVKTIVTTDADIKKRKKRFMKHKKDKKKNGFLFKAKDEKNLRKPFWSREKEHTSPKFHRLFDRN